MRKELATLISDDISILSVDDIAKLKVGVPAVSSYHQIKLIFPSNDSANLNDLDFHAPGYLLNISGHMILQNNNQGAGNEFDAVNNSGVSMAEPNFKAMVMDGMISDIFSILARQGELHLNVRMMASDCKEKIIQLIEKQTNKELAVEKVDKEMTLDLLQVILNAASTLFKCKIVVFYHNDNRVEFDITKELLLAT